MSKKRILLLGPNLNAVSGVSTHLNQLFGSSLAKDFDLVHFKIGSEGKGESKLASLSRLAASPFSLGWAIITKRPAIVHLNTSLDRKAFWRDLVYLYVARVLGKKIVYQVHGGDLPRVLFDNEKGKTKWVERALRKTDMVSLLSTEEMQAYAEFVPDVRCELIPNAIHLDPKVETPTTPKTRPLELVFVGRLAPSKGVAECIKALKLLQEAGRPMRLTIAGSGPQEAELKQLAQNENINFVGPIFDEEKNRLWRESDVFVFPTYHHEGLPYALLESMAAGCVPITTRVGGQPDVMQDGVHGLFIPSKDPRALADAVIKLDDDRNLLLKMAQNGIVRIRDHYNVERLASQFRDVYTSLA
ncbi:MAG: glycosyltransferase family 4 protein [Fimbriimonadales bacterium]